jgi:hypothetical protein
MFPKPHREVKVLSRPGEGNWQDAVQYRCFRVFVLHVHPKVEVVRKFTGLVCSTNWPRQTKPN